MMRLMLFAAVLLAAPLLNAQSLSIKEAVLGQYGEFYPDRLNALQWLADEDLYSYQENDTIVIKDVRGKLRQQIGLPALNKAAALKLDRLPSVTWLDGNRFRFEAKDVWYIYDRSTGKAEQWMQVPEGENITLHEESAHLAYTRENNVFVTVNGQEQQVTDLPDGVTAGQAIARYEFGIMNGLFWSDNGQFLAFYEKDERNVTEYPLVNHLQTPSEPNPIRYPMAGQQSETAACAIYDTRSKSITYLNVNEGRRDDSFYITNVTWAPDHTLIAAILNRGQNEMHLVRFDAGSGEPLDVLFVENDEKYVEPERPPMFIPGSDGAFLWMSERDGFDNLYRYDANGKLQGKTTFDFPISEVIGMDPKGRTCFVAAHGPNPTETHIYSIDLRSMRHRKLTLQSGTHSAKLSDSGRYLIDTYSSLEVPSETVLLTSSGKMSSVLHRAEDPLAGRTIGKTELLTIDADDGTDLWCRLITPPNMVRGQKYPAIVYVYNGPHVQLVTNRWMAGAPLWMHHLAAEGYVVFTVDGRGSSNRGKAFEQAVFRQLGTLEMEDQLAGVGYLKGLPYVDGDRLGIHGWSFGGFMTTSLMLRKPGTFKVGVAGGPVIDWRLYEVMYTERYMDTPEENPKGFERADLTNYIQQLQGNLMLIHGDIDDVVVMQHSMKLIKAAVDNEVQLDFFVYPGHPHNVRGKDRVHLMQKVIGYLKAYL